MRVLASGVHAWLQVSNINTPAVRELSAEEMTARKAGIEAYKAKLGGSRGKSKLAPQQQEEPVPQPGDSHSSSEDTSDAAYASLHMQFEAEEHIKFTAATQGALEF